MQARKRARINISSQSEGPPPLFSSGDAEGEGAKEMLSPSMYRLMSDCACVGGCVSVRERGRILIDRRTRSGGRGNRSH